MFKKFEMELAGRTEELEKLFFSYIKKVKNIHEKKPFEKTPPQEVQGSCLQA